MAGNSHIDLIVGLGNPGEKYARTRHNAGFWFVDEIARQCGATLRSERKFQGEVGRATLDGHDVHLLKPDTFMNLSGQAVQALRGFYKISADRILVVHDEIDLPPGTVRLKRGGGHGGNNGLRDITQKMGKDFLRLRIGVGRPPHSGDVTNYVLGRPSSDDQISIDRAMDDAHRVLPLLLGSGLEKAMHKLHSKADEPSTRKNKSAGSGKADRNGDRRASKPVERAQRADDQKAAPTGAPHKEAVAAKPATTQSADHKAGGSGAAQHKATTDGAGESKTSAGRGAAGDEHDAQENTESRSLRDQLAGWFSGKS